MDQLAIAIIVHQLVGEFFLFCTVESGPENAFAQVVGLPLRLELFVVQTGLVTLNS